jgi:hypothetical protein
MKKIMQNWRGFHNPNLSPIVNKRLEEAITRRQFLTGGAAVGLLYALMNTDYFKDLPDDKQDELIEASPEELTTLDLEDPVYIRAVQDYQKEMEGKENYKDEYEGLSPSEIKQLQFSKIGKLMIAPTKLQDNREWSVAPTGQSQAFGYYAYVSEADLDAIAGTNAEIQKAVDQAYDFYKNFGLTRLNKFVFGQPEFFSYTSAKEANAGKVFDTIETDQKQRNYLTGEMENTKFRKLPLAWTVAHRVLIDQITFMEAELDDPDLTAQEVEQILEKYGVGPEYGKGYSKTSKEDVVKKLRRVVRGSLRRMQDDSEVSGKHSN